MARLQCRELELLQELLAVAAQKVVIDELIKASAVPPINRLPNELLAQIFLLIRVYGPGFGWINTGHALLC